MDFANERYIRVYTRDTTTVLMWAWETTSLWWALLRKVDRAGVIDLGDHDPAATIAVLLRTRTTPPLSVVVAALQEWLQSGSVELREIGGGHRVLVVPNHIEAQEAIQSDAARQRRARELRRDLGALTVDVTETVPPVTRRDARVTRRDAPDRKTVAPVTPSHAESLQPSQPSQTNHHTGAARQPAEPASVSEEEPCAESPMSKPSRRRTQADRGHRLPEDWAPSEALYEWARKTEGVRLDRDVVERSADEFRDYWRGVAGLRGRKLDWDATFRNRLRDIRNRHPEWPEPRLLRAVDGGEEETTDVRQRLTPEQASEWRRKASMVGRGHE